MQLESLECRRLFAGEPGVLADLQVDANRDGRIDEADVLRENRWTPGRGAIILPNLDRDNTAAGAPDNWSGGSFNGRPVAPNNVIDNAADLLDIGVIRLAKLKTLDAYNYTLTIRVLRPASDPAWFKNTAATDRVRLFLPGKVDGADTVLQPGDSAAMGRGIGHTIRFRAEPVALSEYSIFDVAGDGGGYYLGIEGIKPGAVVRVEATLEWTPVIADGEPPPPELINRDVVELKVAPFTLLDNRQRVRQVIVENLNEHPVGFDNADVRAKLRALFGDDAIESKNGDFWQQDGYEIGYVKAPYGEMNLVLELPRARLAMGEPNVSMRTFVRGTLLGPGVGVSLDLAGFPIGDNSSLGGDIDTVFKPGSDPGTPGFLLMSNMPTFMRKFFDAQGVNGKAIDLPLEWLGVNHVDEVIQQTPTGKVLVADPDVAWALLLWAAKLDPNARMHPGMNGNEGVEGYTPEGLKVRQLLKDRRLRWQNLAYAQQPGRLATVREKIREALGLKDEVTRPVKGATTRGDVSLSRGGAFAQMLGDVERTFEVRFTGSDAYRLRYRDAGGAWSEWYAGSRSADAVFPEARAFILKNYWSGTAQKGDSFTYKTVPGATLLRVPQLFASGGLLSDPADPPRDPILTPFSVNHINSLVDGTTVVTGNAFGPEVAWQDETKRDLLQGYVNETFGRGGYTSVEVVDTTTYHNSGGSLHCGTNTIREIPARDWWA